MDSPAAAPASRTIRTHSGRGTADQLLAFQRLAWSSITLSVTRRCPLQCSHCITRSGPHLAEPILSVSTARRWAEELPQLASLGLRHLSFTGGEPLLAVDAVRVLSDAALQAGVSNYVVTSGAWASSSSVADRIVRSLSSVTRWDVGYDNYHAEGLVWSRFANAIAALNAVSAQYTVRVCVGEDPSATQKLLGAIADAIGPGGTIMTQPVRALGRATTPSNAAVSSERLPRRPCVSTGLFVRADGSTGPCCSGLAYEIPGRHPFDYGSTLEPGGLLQAWRAWRADPLLRMMRLTGLAGLEGWLSDAQLLSNEEGSAQDPCEACVMLWRSKPQAAALLATRARSPAVIQRLDALEEVFYGQVWTEQTS